MTLVIHGGAGGDGPWLTRLLEPTRILVEAGTQTVGDKLESGVIDCLEAVTAAVEMLEMTLFNAGKGSVIGEDGAITMDASIMRGTDKAASSVVNVTKLRHPIRAAANPPTRRPVMLNRMQQTNSVSARVSRKLVRMADNGIRRTNGTWKSSMSDPGATDEDDSLLDHDLEGRITTEFSDEGMGTVGAVAVDNFGKLAAATSTGGMTGKPLGRIGDTPIIGAGTWSDESIAISCTGVGEAYIRTCAAHRLAMDYQNSNNLAKSANKILDAVAPLGGRGGLIAVTSDGEFVMPFQTRLMYRGSWYNGETKIGIGPHIE